MTRLASLLILLAFTPTLALATTYVVKPDGTGDFPTIQAAIDAAVDGDIIELTDGTFTGQGNRDVGYLGKSIRLCSKSGNAEACIIDCGGTDSEPHRGFLFSDGESPWSALESVTIINGYATGPHYPQSNGGAVLCTAGSSPTLIDCIFSHNFGEWGGAVFCFEASNATLIHCTFSGNFSGHSAGGMFCQRSSPTLTDCRFLENEGGGLQCYDWAHPTIKGCTFTDNLGWGMMCFFHTDPSLTDCIFTGNNNTGLFCYEYASPTLTNCHFDDNLGDDYGGGVYCLDFCSPTLRNCTFTGNRAVSRGGGMRCYRSPATLISCIFSENSADEGGGFSCAFEAPNLISCTFVGNVAESAGGAVSCDNSSPIMTNCTFYGNRAQRGAVVAALLSNTFPELTNSIVANSSQGQPVHCEWGVVTLSCCDVYGNEEGDWVGCIADQYGINGNISEDPLFCNPENGDLTIRSDSPCAPFSPPNEDCDLIGAWPVGCEPPTATMETTWGRIKARYR